MCARFPTAALAAALMAATAAAADPPVTFQTRPIADGIKVARVVAGWAPLSDHDKTEFAQAEKVFAEILDPKVSGLDATRPVVGYVFIPADVEKSVGVAVVPLADGKTFQAYLAKYAKGKIVDRGGGLFELDEKDDKDDKHKKDDARILFRVAGKNAYFAVGKDPTAALDPAGLIAPEKLYDAKEKSLVSARAYFDRFPKELRQQAVKAIEQALAEAQKGLVPADVGPDAKRAGELVLKMLTRYADQLEEADGAVARADLNTSTGEVSLAAALVPKPGTSLARDLAARKPVTNRFAGLVAGADTVAGLGFRLPLWSEELRGAAVIGLEAAQKAVAEQIKNGDGAAMFEPLAKEAFAGLIRTAKSGEPDLAVVVTGPDAGGHFTVVGAVAFDDPAKLEAEIKKLVEMVPPAKDLVQLDAAKAGAVGIHLVTIPTELPAEAQKVFGDKAKVGLAFAPKGIFVAFGPDPAASLKAAVAGTAKPAPVFDVRVNPARLAKLVAAVASPKEAELVRTALGSADKPVSMFSVAVTSGKELNVTVAFNLKALLGVAAVGAADKGSPAPKKVGSAPAPGKK